MEKLFSYGTLQLEQVQHDTFGHLLQGEPATLTGYIVGEVEITDAASYEVNDNVRLEGEFSNDERAMSLG